MKKKMVWLTAVLAAFGLIAQAEMVITSPTGLPDESDVALESAVKAVKEMPADTVKAVGDVVSFTSDELRNTAHGIKSAFEGDTPREAVRQEMLGEVTKTWSRADGILMRTYTVSPTLGEEMAPSVAEKDTAVDVRGFFAGIEFPEGATAYYRPKTRRLVVLNRPASLDAIEDVLSLHHRGERDYKQVEIKSKFIEVSQGTFNQLGFSWSLEDASGDGTHLFGDWTLNDNQPAEVLSAGLRNAAGAFGGSHGAGTMMLTKTGWMPLSVVIQAMEQDSNSDVLSAPSLTTMDGKAAEIWIGEDRAVPKAFAVKSSDINIHIEHKSWSSELMGVHFTVTPEIMKENLIRLKLNPKIIDLIGYDTYKVGPQADMLMVNGGFPNQVAISGRFPILNVPGVSSAYDAMRATLDSEGNTSSLNLTASSTSGTPPFYNNMRVATHEEIGVPLAAVNGSLPYFRVREIKTQVEVTDGSTVGLGGLIYDRLETYKDKVPVLGSIPLIGRLFRSEGERSIKRNLMIFVSASQIANDGRRKSDVALNN